MDIFETFKVKCEGCGDVFYSKNTLGERTLLNDGPICNCPKCGALCYETEV